MCLKSKKIFSFDLETGEEWQWKVKVRVKSYEKTSFGFYLSQMINDENKIMRN